MPCCGDSLKSRVHPRLLNSGNERKHQGTLLRHHSGGHDSRNINATIVCCPAPYVWVQPYLSLDLISFSHRLCRYSAACVSLASLTCLLSPHDSCSSPCVCCTYVYLSPPLAPLIPGHRSYASSQTRNCQTGVSYSVRILISVANRQLSPRL